LYSARSVCVSLGSAAFGVIMILSALAGVIGLAASADADNGGSVLRIGFTQPIDSLNPMMGVTDSAYVFYGLVYDALHSIGNDLETVPNLALETTTVPISDSELVASGEPFGSVWNYEITAHATWNDGQPFTVDDVVYNINLNCQNYENMSAYQPYAYFMQYAEAIDDSDVRIHFYDRDSMEPIPCSYADFVNIPMLPQHKLSQMNASQIANDWEGVFDDANPPIVGTGPFLADEFVYDEWNVGDQITLLKNPNYHAKADSSREVKFDSIVLRFFDSAQQMAEALQTGEIDVAQFPPDVYQSIKSGVQAGTTLDIQTFDGLKCTQYWTEIAFCMQNAGPNPSRLDPAVRQALEMATDKESIVSDYYLDLADIGSTLISPVSSFWHYEPSSSELFAFNLELANQTLENAGYVYRNAHSQYRSASDASFAVQQGLVPRNTELRFEMLVRSDYPEELEIASYLREQWAKVGVGLTYVVVSEESLADIAYSYDYDMMIWYWSSDPDPNYMLFCESSKSWYGWSDNMYYNASYEDNYTRSVMELQRGQRKSYVDECQRIFYRDVGYIILAYPYQTYAWRTDTFTGWGNWETDPGRSIDNFWTANPLYFDLEPAGGGGNMMVLIAAGIGIVAAVAIIAVFILKRKKKREPEKK